MSGFIETPTIGEILNKEFLIPLGISAYKLAQEINVPTSRIQDILHNRRKNNSRHLFTPCKVF